MQISRRAFALSMAAATWIGAPARAQGPEPFVPSHPLYGASVDMLKQGRWIDLVSSVAALPPQSALNLLTTLGDGSPVVGDLMDLAGVKSGAAIAGAIHVGWAWQSRGRAQAIQDEEGFVRHLDAASGLLRRAQQQDPDDGVSLSFLFRVLKGNGESDALRAILPAYLAAKRKPVGGLAAYADAVSAKWTGSEAESLAFARRYADSAPAASFGLIPDAHATAAGARLMSGDVSEQQSALVYFRKPEVMAEVVAADKRFLAGPVDADRFAAVLAHAQFSFAFVQMNDLDRARRHLVGQGLSAVGPWTTTLYPNATLARVRAALGIDRT
jgi:hypothetical protein